MEKPKGVPDTWNLEIDCRDNALDPATLWTVHLSVIINGASGSLSGRVVDYDDDPPFVEHIWLNELLLPERHAQRLLCRLWKKWVGAADGCGMVTTLNLREWLQENYEDGGREVMGLIDMTLRTFAGN